MEADGADGTGKAVWRVEMLGRLRIRCVLPDTPAVIEHFQTQKTAMLFAWLVLRQEGGNAAPPLYRDDLIARLWPDADLDAGRSRLSQALTWLRRHLEAGVGLARAAVLEADRQTVRLVSGVVASDVAEMESLFHKARTLRRVHPVQAALWLEKAIALYHGPFLSGNGEVEDDLLLERYRLEAVFQEMLRGAVVAEAAAGRLPPAIEYARRLLQIDPENEADCALLMRLLEQSGGPAGALRAFADFSARLTAQHLPVPDLLQRLAREIQQRKEHRPLVPPPAYLPPTDSFPPPSAALPLPLTHYFGREQELHLLQTFLQARDPRFLTLLGPGGTGKTRLALETAHRFIAQNTPSDAPGCELARAAFFVSLENIEAASQIMPAIYRALQQTLVDASQESAPPEEAGRLRAAVARLLGTIAHPLLILDNCEHLAGNAAVVGTLTELLRVSPLSILATSRVRMGMNGEQQLAVPPLPAPHEILAQVETDAAGAKQDSLLAYPSVQMFVDRARRARFDFALTAANRDVIAALCQRLEGIPLAIELCAAWAATLAPSEMLDALDNRFDLLVSRRPDAPPRHSSLYAAVESSYLQLPEELRAAFRVLSVFRGGWQADAAQALVPHDTRGAAAIRSTAGFHIRDSLFALQERSLIFTDRPGNGSEGLRWRMLETLREFAWSQSPEAERAASAARHAAWFLQSAENIAPRLALPGQREWLDALETEHDNFQAALATLRAQAAPAVGNTDTTENHPAFSGLRLCIALDRIWLIRGYSRLAADYLAWFLPHAENVLAGDASETAPDRELATLLARGYTAQGRAFAALGDLPAAVAPLQTALQRWEGVGDEAGLAGAQLDLGEVYYWQDRETEGLALLMAGEQRARQAGDALRCASALLTLGSIALGEQDIARAERLHSEALEFARQVDNRRVMARILCNLGEIAREQNHLEAAREWGRQAMAAAEVGDQAAACYIRLSLGRTACDMGDATQAQAYLQDCLRYVRKAGTRRQLMLCLLLSAQVAEMEEQPERCAVALGAGYALREEASIRLIQGEAKEEAALIASARQRLGEAEYEAAFARGARFSADAAADYALNDEEDNRKTAPPDKNN